MKTLVLFILTLFSSLTGYSQTDTAFWFAAPDISSAFNYDRPIMLRITAYQQACNVSISQPAGGGMPAQNLTIAANTTQSIDLSTWINNIECAPGNVIQNKGIKITSDNKIAAYYEVNVNGPNPELFALKGKNALGTEFYISSQYILGNSPVLSPLPISSFNIVASEDNTQVTITPSANIVGHAANVPFTITLNRGQTYAAIASSQVASQHLQGSHVTSAKPIAITLSDDLLQGTAYGGACEDLAGDQTVPVNIIGSEYIAVKSNLNSPFDKVYITATQNGTIVSQDGVVVTTLNAGASAQLTVNNASTYIQSSAPVYAYQLSGIGCEVGGALLPKLTCTGSSSVSVARSTNGTFAVTLLVKNGGQGNFLVNGASGIITAAQFTVVPATGGVWYAAKVSLPLSNYPNGSVLRISNSSHIFQMGIFQGDNLGVGVGYFSDYNTLQAHASTNTQTLCAGSAILLSSDTIPSATYSWTGPNGFTSNAQNPTISNAAILNSGMYKLTVTVPGCGTYQDSVAITVNPCTQDCNNWLKINNAFDAATVGDLDITGNKMTVEASFNATGDITRTLVSKHRDPSDVNYHLLPDLAQITTTNGFFYVLAPCDFAKNKTYHMAMVYDGTTLTLYRNGFIMGSTPASGNLITNNWPATIGENAYGASTLTVAESHPLKGFINEVRMWNVARTQAQIKTYMNSSLPNPSSQTGLQGYYIFDDLLNKQGNNAFNIALKGTASMPATNTSCTFIADSCVMNLPSTNISNIINTYTPVLALNPCNNKITVEDASTFNPGDTVLIIQMKGAEADNSNTSNFGIITSYRNSGNYEFNYVKSKSGNVIELKNNLTRQYDIPVGKVQLVRVPYYTSATVTSTLTCLPWDGSKGGILVLNARDQVDLAANIDVTGKGFLGGNSPNPFTTVLYCHSNNYFYAKGNLNAAAKGEGIATIIDNIAWGKGAAANGGGGGNGHNSGGGGGGNGGRGGFGGYQLEACGNAPFDNRGIGARNLVYNNADKKIFMGGGGGSGHTDNANGSAMPGGNGGGIIIIKSPVIINTGGFQVRSNGSAAPTCNNAVNNCHDGSGGGGAGGTVLIETNFTGNTSIDVSGGKGADLVIFNNAAGAGRIGPGGGGGGGVVWFSNTILQPNVNVIRNGGANGVIIQDNNNPWGATAGLAGISVFDLAIPFDNTLFKTNIDSVRIKDSAKTCTAFDFKGFGYTNANPVASWQWYFGDGATASTQNTSHSYAAPGTYNVKLVITDINGCTDSIVKPVNTTSFNITKSNDTTVCNNASITLFVSGGVSYSWSPSTGLSNPNVANPVATVTSPITYHVTVTNSTGCSKTDSIRLNIKAGAVFSVSPGQSVCPNDPKQLTASGGTSYLWQPATYLSNPNIANPVATPAATTTYTVKIKDSTCNDSALLSTTITALPLPLINASKTNDVDCANSSSQLNATGGISYLWQPAAFLNNPNIANPVAQPPATTLFIVSGTGNNGCKNSDTVIVNVSNSNSAGYHMPNAFTPNNDGLNDCFGLKYWGTVTKLDFSIYNRFGERIFYTTDPSKCWDGRYKGIMQEVGMYVYLIKATTACDVVDKKGTFTLLR